MARAGRNKDRGETFATFENALSKGALANVYLLAGTEQLLVDRAIDMIADLALGSGEDRLNFRTFSGEDADTREIVLAAISYPMFTGKSVVVVRDVGKLRNTERLVAYLSGPSPSTVLVLTSAKPDNRQKLFKLLQEKAFTLSCRPLFDNEVSRWIETEVKRAGRTITPEAAGLMHLSVGNSLAEIRNELDKLYLFTGDKKTIDEDDVASVVGLSRNYSTFELQMAVGLRDVTRSMEILARMIDQGENMTGCVVLMTWYFEKLWRMPDHPGSSHDVVALLGVKEFYARQYIAARRNYSEAQIEECFRALRDADMRLKSSRGTPRVIMTLLLHRIIRPGIDVAAGHSSR